MSFEPSTLKLFVRVASLGAFGKAGREFGLSPTAATQRIQGLETELGVKLFNRTTRAVALTADGEVFLVHAKRIIESIEDARSDLSGGTKNIKGELRVAGSASFGRRYIAPYITEFLRAYPDVRVRLELSDGVVDIVEQGFDLALRIGTLTSSTLVARKLAENPRLLVATKAYLDAAGRPQRPEDLAAHNCIVLGENRNWKLRDTTGEVHEVRVTGNFTTNYGEVITEAALAGGGIALKSLWDIRHLLTAGSLLPVLEDYTVEPVWSLWAVRPPGQVAPARVRAFIDFMEMKFRELQS
ncbi:MAG: LysR family transcriptional regulator [Candidatus Competibacteraceae bacterium]|nr:LysR family transcriptional regulator [Candidatus Competibacteraceae bacterium]